MQLLLLARALDITPCTARMYQAAIWFNLPGEIKNCCNTVKKVQSSILTQAFPYEECVLIFLVQSG